MVKVVPASIITMYKAEVYFQALVLQPTSSQGPVARKIPSPKFMLNMEKTMVAKVISKLKVISRYKSFLEYDPRPLRAVM